MREEIQTGVQYEQEMAAKLDEIDRLKQEAKKLTDEMQAYEALGLREKAHQIAAQEETKNST